eukprot:g1661.t1
MRLLVLLSLCGTAVGMLNQLRGAWDAVGGCDWDAAIQGLARTSPSDRLYCYTSVPALAAKVKGACKADLAKEGVCGKAGGKVDCLWGVPKDGGMKWCGEIPKSEWTYHKNVPKHVPMTRQEMIAKVGLSGPGIPWCTKYAVTTGDTTIKKIDGKSYRGVEDRPLSDDCKAATRAASAHYCKSKLEEVCRRLNNGESKLKSAAKQLLAEIKDQKRNGEASLKCDPSLETAGARMETECAKTEHTSADATL